MKKVIFFILATAAVISACSLDVDSIMPAAQAVVDPGYGGQVKFAVWSSGPWTATIESSKDFNPSIEPTSGPEGETLITLTLPENLTTEDRAASISFSCGEAMYSTTVYQYRPHMLIGGQSVYYATKMKDGNWWTVSNYADLPRGKSTSKTDFSNNTGIWIPCETIVAEDGSATVKPATSIKTVYDQGYFFTAEEYLKNEDDNPVQGICAEGWHIPNVGEWLELLIAYGDKETGEADVKNLNEDNLNLFPYQYVIDGERYADEVLNNNEDSDFKNMASVGMFGTNLQWDEDNIMALVLHNTAERTYAVLEPVSKNNGVNVRCVRDKVVE